MKNIALYEYIPEKEFPLRINFNEFGQYDFRAHWHEHVEIHCVFEGSALLRCGEDTVLLEKGDCAIINANELHQGIRGKCCYGCLIIPPRFFGKNYVFFERLVKGGQIYELMCKIFDENKQFNSVSSLSIMGYTYLLIATLINGYSKKNFNEIGYRRYFEKLETVNKAIQYIEEHYTENVTTLALSEMVHLSEGHFCHLFKEVTRMSAKEYLLQCRIRRAVELLKSSNMSITDVCYTCGFSDPNYFSRIFKKKTGDVPSNYRK